MGVKKVGESEVRNPASGRRVAPSDVLQETIWMRLCCAVVVCSISVWLGRRLQCVASAWPGVGNPKYDLLKDFLIQKELELEMIENRAILNYNRQCDWLASCGNFPTNCSHHSYSPLLGVTDQRDQVCQPVSINKYICALSGTSGNGTPYMYTKFDFTKGFVRNQVVRPCSNATTYLAGKQRQKALWRRTNFTKVNRTASTQIPRNIPHATPIKLTATKYKLQQIGAPHLSVKEIVAIICTLIAATLSGVISLLVFLYCRNQRRIRNRNEAFLRSIEAPIPDVPIVDPLRAIVQEGQNAVEMAIINPEPWAQPAE